MASKEAQSVIYAMQQVLDVTENMPDTDEAWEKTQDWIEKYCQCFTGEEEQDFAGDVFVACLKYVNAKFMKKKGGTDKCTMTN